MAVSDRIFKAINAVSDANLISIDERTGFRQRFAYYRYWNREWHVEEPLLPLLSDLFSDTVRPLKSMKEDFVNTVYPYDENNPTSHNNLGRDIIQPIRGLGTGIESVAALLFFPILVLWFAVKTLWYVVTTPFKLLVGAIKGEGKGQEAINGLKQIVALAAFTTTTLLGGLFKVLRAVTQIATTPLTWFFRVPLRMLLSSELGMTGFLGRFQTYRDYNFAGRTEGYISPLASPLYDFLKNLSLDMLGPLYAMKNDFFATKKPYRLRRGASLEDAIQPIRGIGTILQGVAGIVAFPLFVVALAVWAPFKLVGALGKAIINKATGKQYEQPAAADAKQVVGFAVLTAYALLGGVLKMVRGLTQIATTPLTWFFRIPYRSHVTAQEVKKKTSSYADMNEKMPSEKRGVITELSREGVNNSFQSPLKTGEGSATRSSPSDKPQQQSEEQKQDFGTNHTTTTLTLN